MNGAHSVQFFDSRESLGTDVAAFLRDGLESGERLMLIARPLHVESIGEALVEEGLGLDTLARDGRLLLIDLRSTLRELMAKGRPDPAVFETRVGAPLRKAASGGPIRAYGELVDLLAVDDNLRAGQEVEQLWNGLTATLPLRLRCGYTSATFAAGAGCGQAMKAICAQHGHVQRNEDDLLANWLLTQHVASGPLASGPR